MNGLEIVSTHPDGPRAGECVVGIRPERMVLLDGEAPGRPNVYAGVTVATVFHGAFAEHHVRLDATGDVVVCQTIVAPGGAEPATPAQRTVHVHVPPDAVLRVMR